MRGERESSPPSRREHGDRRADLGISSELDGQGTARSDVCTPARGAMRRPALRRREQGWHATCALSHDSNRQRARALLRTPGFGVRDAGSLPRAPRLGAATGVEGPGARSSPQGCEHVRPFRAAQRKEQPWSRATSRRGPAFGVELRMRGERESSPPSRREHGDHRADLGLVRNLAAAGRSAATFSRGHVAHLHPSANTQPRSSACATWARSSRTAQRKEQP